MSVTSIVETVTPELAQEYLRMSGGNRNISKGVVDSYAKTMIDGKWLLNGEAIVFDNNGVLLNGHHRLHAIIKANTPIRTFVTRGVEPESFTTFDCGRHRTVGQLIGMQGIKHYNCVASALQVSYRLLHKLKVGDNNALSRIWKTNTDMIEYFNQDRELFIEAGRFAQELRSKCPVLEASIIGGTFHYLVRHCHYSEDTVKKFFEQINSYDTCAIQSLDILRKRLLQNKNEKNTRKLVRNVLYALIIKTWNSYVLGEDTERKLIKFIPEKESYPEFIINDGSKALARC